MKFGVCGGPEIARIARQAGYDYFEWSVGGLLHPREEERVFEEALAQVHAVGLPCPAVNVFLPADLKVTGPDANLEALRAYVTTAFRRAGQAGVEIIVFGSGGARRIPDGFDRAAAMRQLVEFGKMAAPLAGQWGVTLVVEPLNVTETNVLNTVEEAAGLVRAVDHPNFMLLVDGYHWAKDHDTLAGIRKNAGLVRHAHIATVEGRRPPRPEDDCAEFLKALVQSGYTGRISIEGRIDAPEEELPVALETMRRLVAA